MTEQSDGYSVTIGRELIVHRPEAFRYVKLAPEPADLDVDLDVLAARYGD